MKCLLRHHLGGGSHITAAAALVAGGGTHPAPVHPTHPSARPPKLSHRQPELNYFAVNACGHYPSLLPSCVSSHTPLLPSLFPSLFPPLPFHSFLCLSFPLLSLHSFVSFPSFLCLFLFFLPFIHSSVPFSIFLHSLFLLISSSFSYI
ncbi:hypothetical protein E2C01_102283 [Portunus trituberculatus]|uniref:Uncharacterized protein n=1 Tax=Portunus trituberculatus TaxID=210409 RepID=A0A5B7KME6_PORTR|nr:hypothetical protein [Portunus trituberculatus]